MQHWRIPLADAVVHITMTDREFGSVDVASVPAGADQVVDRPWVQARQVHGADVLVIDDAPLHGAEADVLVTARRDIALAVRSADCATLALVGDDGSVAAVHAGWRGLAAGAIGVAAAELRGRGAQHVCAVVGPHIGVECYEFGGDDLVALAAQFGDDVIGRTSDERPALDVAAAVRRALDEASVELIASDARCTACSDELWSHRAAGDTERQALVVWIESA